MINEYKHKQSAGTPSNSFFAKRLPPTRSPDSPGAETFGFWQGKDRHKTRTGEMKKEIMEIIESADPSAGKLAEN